MKKKLKSMLDEKRYLHSLGVSKLSCELAKRYGEDENKAYIAGILHDCAKNIPFLEAKKLCKEYGIILDDIELKNPALIHAPLGAEIAKREFGIEDLDIYNAIKNHTVARAEMSRLEKIVYLADIAEESRKFEGVEKIRELIFEDLDKAVLETIKFTVKFNLDKDKLIHPDTINAWNYIKSYEE